MSITKPHSPVLNRDHSMVQGLRGAWLFNEYGGLTVHDYSGFRQHGTLTTMDPATDWVMDTHGSVLEFDGVADTVEIPSPTSALDITADLTLAWRWKTSSIDAGDMPIGFDMNGAPWDGYAVRMGNGCLNFMDGADWRTLWDNAKPTRINDGEWRSGVIRVFGALAELYTDGTFRDDVGVSNPRTVNTHGRRTIAGRDGGGDWPGTFAYLYVFARKITVNEIMALHVDPYFMFRPPGRKYFVPAAPGGPSIPVAWHHYSKNIGAA